HLASFPTRRSSDLLAYLQRFVSEVLPSIWVASGPGGMIRRSSLIPVVVWSHARSRVFRQRTTRRLSPTVTLTLTARYIESAAGQPGSTRPATGAAEKRTPSPAVPTSLGTSPVLFDRQRGADGGGASRWGCTPGA